MFRSKNTPSPAKGVVYTDELIVGYYEDELSAYIEIPNDGEYLYGKSHPMIFISDAFLSVIEMSKSIFIREIKTLIQVGNENYFFIADRDKQGDYRILAVFMKSAFRGIYADKDKELFIDLIYDVTNHKVENLNMDLQLLEVGDYNENI